MTVYHPDIHQGFRFIPESQALFFGRLSPMFDTRRDWLRHFPTPSCSRLVSSSKGSGFARLSQPLCFGPSIALLQFAEVADLRSKTRTMDRRTAKTLLRKRRRCDFGNSNCGGGWQGSQDVKPD